MELFKEKGKEGIKVRSLVYIYRVFGPTAATVASIISAALGAQASVYFSFISA